MNPSLYSCTSCCDWVHELDYSQEWNKDFKLALATKFTQSSNVYDATI